MICEEKSSVVVLVINEVSYRCEGNGRGERLLSDDSIMPKGNQGDQDGGTIPYQVPQGFNPVMARLVLQLFLSDLEYLLFEAALPGHELRNG
jgi:hypothetical protein